LVAEICRRTSKCLTEEELVTEYTPIKDWLTARYHKLIIVTKSKKKSKAIPVTGLGGL
jgi:hypothetical protein